MTAFGKNFRMDPELETGGAKYDALPKNDDGTQPIFYIGRFSESNPAHAKAQKAASEPFKQKIRMQMMEPSDWRAINKKTFVEGSLKGWTDVQDEAGQPIPFNKQNAQKLMDDYPELYSDMFEFANERNNYKLAIKEIDSGNSST